MEDSSYLQPPRSTQRVRQLGPQLMPLWLALLGELQVKLERQAKKLRQRQAELPEALALLVPPAPLACYLGWQQGLESPQGERLSLARRLGWLMETQ